MKHIKTIQLFENYNESYQPYIPPVLDALKSSLIEVLIYAFRGKAGSGVKILPSYSKRKIIQKLCAIARPNQSSLDYVSILAIRKQVDVLHLQQSYLFPKILTLLSIPSDKRPKVVITLRGGDTYVKPWYSKKWFDFYANYGNKVDAFVVMSQHQKMYLHQKWDVALSRIHVIPISFGETNNTNEKVADLTELRIVSAFRMCWEKNIAGNFRVIRQLKTQGIPVRYDLYGDGVDAGQVYYLVDKYDLKDIVYYHGRVSNDELKEKLKQSDFFLQLSHSESLGMSVIEAQSYGLPAIVSSSDGLPEAIKDGETGYCVNPYDIDAAANCLKELWSNPVLYDAFSKAAISYSHSKFSISNEVTALEALYKKLVNQ
ncbi:glycosyltransferase family 4 protein [Corallibacter sp.]|uniref:glycosyltransferase family 4 protein n=1 Tax=Corallibacter sp. TaxID=2038084 RepID=UPI003AB75AD3